MNTQPNRATADLKSWKKWDSEAIKARQTSLVALAWQIWGITVPIKPKEAEVTGANPGVVNTIATDAAN